ncbi:MAG TPA: urate oxidase [Solirubrobacteraceae bacterium]|nr:urate oxidase [Solirubrobacteraceae bacterium]
MAIALTHNNYGKSEIRLVKVVRRPDHHELRDLTVDVSLEGDFDAAHIEGDNTGLLATDTMRNTVYALAKEDPIESIESFGVRLVEHFIAASPAVQRARVRVVEHPWARLEVDGRPHEHAFQRGNGGERVATVVGDGAEIRVEAGIDDLLVLKTTDSGWEGFVRDRYTSLAETSDRILATVITARWSYGRADVDYGQAWHDVHRVILETFGDHYSPSVQFTLHRMGRAVLEAVPEVDRIHFSLPNKHHLRYDLERFGLENENEIFHATTEPYGLIEGTVERVPEAVPVGPNGTVTEAAPHA